MKAFLVFLSSSAIWQSVAAANSKDECVDPRGVLTDELHESATKASLLALAARLSVVVYLPSDKWVGWLSSPKRRLPPGEEGEPCQLEVLASPTVEEAGLVLGVFKHRPTSTTFVSFRGTQLEDLKDATVDEHFLFPPMPSGSELFAHSAWEEYRASLGKAPPIDPNKDMATAKKWLEQWLREQGDEYVVDYIVGHSLGGAYALTLHSLALRDCADSSRRKALGSIGDLEEREDSTVHSLCPSGAITFGNGPLPEAWCDHFGIDAGNIVGSVTVAAEHDPFFLLPITARTAQAAHRATWASSSEGCTHREQCTSNSNPNPGGPTTSEESAVKEQQEEKTRCVEVYNVKHTCVKNTHWASRISMGLQWQTLLHVHSDSAEQFWETLRV